MDPIQRKDNFEIWRQRTNEIISKLGSLASTTQTVISEMPPPIAYAGDLWWDSSSGKLKIYYDDGDSLQWTDAFLESQSTNTTISENPPQYPKIGDFWWDSSSGKLKIYYHDGNSCQWTDTFTSSESTSKAEVYTSEIPPSSPFVGQLWWDSQFGKLKIFYNDGNSVQWIDAFVYHNTTTVNVSEFLPQVAVPGELWWDATKGKLKIYYDDDNSQQWIDAFVYHNNTVVNFSESLPSEALPGELWWDSSNLKLKIYYSDDNSSQWVDAVAYNSNSVVYSSETVSNNPSVGELWWDPSKLKLKIYHDDGNSQQWIDTSPSFSTDFQQITDFVQILEEFRDVLNVIEYDTSYGHTFQHNSAECDWKINFVNLNMKPKTKTVLTVIVEQDSVGYIPSEIRINDNFVGVRWKKNTALDSGGNVIPGTNCVDRILYDVYCIDPILNEYIVLAEIESF